MAAMCCLTAGARLALGGFRYLLQLDSAQCLRGPDTHSPQPGQELLDCPVVGGSVRGWERIYRNNGKFGIRRWRQRRQAHQSLFGLMLWSGSGSRQFVKRLTVLSPGK